MTQKKSLFNFLDEVEVGMDISYQFIYRNNLEVWMQFEPIQIYTITRNQLLFEAKAANKDTVEVFHAKEPQGTIYPGDTYHFSPRENSERKFFQTFSRPMNGICEIEEELTLSVLFSIQWTQHAHQEEVCNGLCEELLRPSPYERFTVTVSYGKIERLDDNDSWETAYFFTQANYKPRDEFFDLKKSRTAHFNRISLRCYEPTSDEAIVKQIV